MAGVLVKGGGNTWRQRERVHMRMEAEWSGASDGGTSRMLTASWDRQDSPPLGTSQSTVPLTPRLPTSGFQNWERMDI